MLLVHLSETTKMKLKLKFWKYVLFFLFISTALCKNYLSCLLLLRYFQTFHWNQVVRVGSFGQCYLEFVHACWNTLGTDLCAYFYTVPIIMCLMSSPFQRVIKLINAIFISWSNQNRKFVLWGSPVLVAFVLGFSRGSKGPVSIAHVLVISVKS